MRNNNVSKKEEQLAEFIKKRNLNHANRIAARVHPKNSLYAKYIKRILDLVIIVPTLLIISPVLFLLSIINLFVMGKPILYRQIRSGYKGKSFEMFKFRSMKNTLGPDGRLLPSNQRLTKYGKFIRKFSLDELPNLFNILRGDMSIIGPRPLPVEFEERYNKRHKQRCLVRPGLECPCIHTDNHVRMYQEQFENDIWYVENISFLVDVKMMLSLLRMVLNSKERDDHADVNGGNFIGYDEQGEAFSMRKIPEQYKKEFEEYMNEHGKYA